METKKIKKIKCNVWNFFDRDYNNWLVEKLGYCATEINLYCESIDEEGNAIIRAEYLNE